MVAETIQVNAQGDWLLDLITGAVAVFTGGLALATFLLARQTRDAVKIAEKEAEATIALGVEARRDRELAIQPVLLQTKVYLDSPDGHGVQIRNIGRGPALRTRVWLWTAGEWFWSQEPGLAVGAGETYPPQPETRVPVFLYLNGRRGAASLPGIPGSGAANEDLWAYCLDQLGNALQFNLRTGDPPEVSRRDDKEPKAWVSAIYDYE